MKTAVERVSDWLHGQLTTLPEPLTAMYVEWGHCYSPQMLELVVISTFGFEDLSRESFDCSKPDHLPKLGDFVWEGRADLQFRSTEFPKADWTSILKGAAAKPDVRHLVRSRTLLLLVGYHDGEVFDVS